MKTALLSIILLLSLSLFYGKAQNLGAAPLAAPEDTSFKAAPGKVISMEGSFLRPLHKRDSILIADQLFYGAVLKDVAEGTAFSLPDYSRGIKDSVEVLSPWIIDTVKVSKIRKTGHRLYDIEAKLLITSFDEGRYVLPSIRMERTLPGGPVDTLVFDSRLLEVKTMPLDTASFKPHDIKGQIRYPLTFKEIFPYLAGAWIFAVLFILIMSVVMIKRRKEENTAFREPPHITALRKLDRLRSNKFWAPEKQKAFYSGVTDALREYIVSRYGFGAMEMTTAEIFNELKFKDVPVHLYDDLKGLFECSDYVKYAKHTASDEENARVLPIAVKFVTETYQAILDEEAENKALEEEAVSEKPIKEREDDSAYMPK